ncbi:hypothetical protein BGW36DRAFT_433881 [Talaromyces proteolyticus]|uniref:Uncharacterized protein n=1 Tax=Talaromyces proteolyticus TaxID=1131652 RepID=A0AAD4PRL5_9EURO|nr:uncharacterized protein BGW36DRAFT_433881 [Talaromyces proteolyticus]KAH8689117.1 hypothetical protein BGW36DRAFT_433881 [Talaromyces proteolyticus]
MVGNDKGLSIVDVIQERLDALESRAEIREQETKSLKANMKSLKADIKSLKADNESLKADNESFESEMQLIRIPELLRFLPSGQRPDNRQRNQLVHGANVKFDLSFLDSLSTKNLSFLSNHRLQISDLDKAFNKRYENNPGIFRREMSDTMGEVINMRSNLLNLDVWKSVTDPTRKKKIKNLRRKCGRLIKKWLSQPEPQPYSEEEMQSRLDGLYREYHAYVVQ